jgi:hypothetical protein
MAKKQAQPEDRRHSREPDQGQVDRLAEFEARIAQLRGDRVDSPDRRWRTPWADLAETHKLYRIVWESWTEWHGSPVPGSEALSAIERNVDYAGLPDHQREMLQNLRARLDAGQLAEPLPGQRDRVEMALSYIVGSAEFEEGLRSLKENRDLPWAELPENVKVNVLRDMEHRVGPAALAALEKEGELRTFVEAYWDAAREQMRDEEARPRPHGVSGQAEAMSPSPGERDNTGEWEKDYAARRDENRCEREGVSTAAALHPWPSEIAAANWQKQTGQDQGKSGGGEKANGHDDGHSM